MKTCFVTSVMRFCQIRAIVRAVVLMLPSNKKIIALSNVYYNDGLAKAKVRDLRVLL